MKAKYEIRTKSATGSLWGWSHTRERAFARAEQLSLSIRADLPVCVVLAGKIVGKTGTNSGHGGVAPRKIAAAE